MSYLEADLRWVFGGGDNGSPATQWFSSRGYAGRNWDGLCMGVVNWALWFTTGVEQWPDTATAGCNASPDAYTMDPYAAEAGDVLWFAVSGLADGHVMLALGGGRFLHAHSLIQEQWGDHLGVVDYNWFKSQRPWYTLRGITKLVGDKRIDLVAARPTPPVVVPVGQRTVGWTEGVTIRSAPTSKSGAKGVLVKGWNGIFTEYVIGEDPYGNGKNVWLKSGDSYFYADAFTNPTTDGLTLYVPPKPQIAVTLDLDNGSNNNALVTVEQGAVADLKPDPIKPGFSFIGWFKSPRVAFDLTTPITAPITLTAHWKADPVVVPPVQEPPVVEPPVVIPDPDEDDDDDDTPVKPPVRPTTIGGIIAAAIVVIVGAILTYLGLK